MERVVTAEQIRKEAVYTIAKRYDDAVRIGRIVNPNFNPRIERGALFARLFPSVENLDFSGRENFQAAIMIGSNNPELKRSSAGLLVNSLLSRVRVRDEDVEYTTDLPFSIHDELTVRSYQFARDGQFRNLREIGRVMYEGRIPKEDRPRMLHLQKIAGGLIQRHFADTALLPSASLEDWVNRIEPFVGENPHASGQTTALLVRVLRAAGD